MEIEDVIRMISCVPNHIEQLLQSGSKIRKGEDGVKPSAIIAYNRAKKEVDVSHQMSSYYTSLRKSFKWYRKVIFAAMHGQFTITLVTAEIYNENNVSDVEAGGNQGR